MVSQFTVSRCLKIKKLKKMTQEEFFNKIQEILGIDWHVFFDKFANQTIITVYSRCDEISLRTLKLLSKITKSDDILFKSESGWYGDITTNIIINGFCLDENDNE